MAWSRLIDPRSGMHRWEGGGGDEMARALRVPVEGWEVGGGGDEVAGTSALPNLRLHEKGRSWGGSPEEVVVGRRGL